MVEDSGKKAVKVPGDIGDEAHCQRLVEEAVGQFGKIDVLVNNAAYQMYCEGIQSISARPAGGARPRLRLPRLPGVELRQW